MSSLPLSPSAAPATAPDTRVGADRRRRPTPILSRYWLRGRRRGGRRAGETVRIYVDRYSGQEYAAAGALVVLSAIDLVLTLIHLDQGGGEANPVMALSLAASGTGGFVVAKGVLTVVGVLGLLLHARFPLGRRALQGAVLLYLGLMVWHGVVWADRLG